MNPEALEYSYGLFKNDGYNGSLEEYQELIATNQEAKDYSFNLFTSDGYNGSIEDFSTLVIGEGTTTPRKSKYLDFGEEEVIVEDEVVDGEVVEEDVEVIEEEKQALPKIDRVEKVKEELAELESSFGYDPKWAPETLVEEEKLDE